MPPTPVRSLAAAISPFSARSRRVGAGRLRCAAAAVLALLGACGGGSEAVTPDAGVVDAGPDAAIAPIFRNPVDLDDEELAGAALALLGAPVEGAVGSCSGCHGITRQSVRHWRALGDTTMNGCLTDLAVSDPTAARTMIDCLRTTPADPASPFSPDKLGVYSTAVDLPWFAYLFTLAYGADGADAHAAFVDRVQMPRGGEAPLIQEQFDVLAEYFTRGLPRLDELMPDDPPPEACTPGVSDDVATHVATMATQGWAAVNRDADLPMFGCGATTDPRDCLSDEPRQAGWEVPGGAVIRELAELDYATSFWTRSSADGRFVSHGSDTSSTNPFNAQVIDLQRGVTMGASAFYDPGFFPDNSGFALQAVDAHFCEQSVLATDPGPISFNESGCSTTGLIGLYQHLGSALGGGDHFTIDSQFVSDDGGHVPTLGDPAAFFSSGAFFRLTRMIHDGTTFETGGTVSVPTAFEGDSVISPSTRLVITRVAGPGEEQLGFVLRRIDTKLDGTIAVPEIARYCMNGGKPSFSFDERWLVYHHYVGADDAVDLGFSGPDDPAFAPYLSSGASNLYLLDVLDGSFRRITDMGPGQYALFPHFRSDGWIYFAVRDLANGESIQATDAMLVAGG